MCFIDLLLLLYVRYSFVIIIVIHGTINSTFINICIICRPIFEGVYIITIIIIASCAKFIIDSRYVIIFISHEVSASHWGLLDG